MSVHQSVNSIGLKIYNGFWYKNRNWHIHLHKSFEFAFVEKGSLSVAIGKEIYTVKSGEALLIFPYQPHSYTVIDDSLYFVSVFSGDYCEAFSSFIKNSKPESPIFTPNTYTIEYLRQKIMPSPPAFTDFFKVPTPPFFDIKSSLYSIASDFLKSTKLIEKNQNTEPLFEVLCYIEEHFTENITLSSVADAISYDYHYISRIFNENFNINFKTLINQYRSEKAAQLLLNSKDSVSDIAFICGFQSLRSFNRVFLEYSGLTPTEFRNNLLKDNI